MYGALTGEPFRPLTANISHNANGQNTTNTDQPLVKCKVISSWDQFGWSSPSLQKKTDFSACCFAPVFFSGGKSVCFHRLVFIKTSCHHKIPLNSRYHFFDSRNGCSLFSQVTNFWFSSHNFGKVAAIQKFQYFQN